MDLQARLEREAVANALRNRKKLEEMAPGTNVQPGPNTYYVDNPNLNVYGWAVDEGPNKGRVFVTPAGGGRMTMGHEQFHAKYSPDGIPMPKIGTPEHKELIKQLRAKMSMLDKEGYIGKHFSLNMGDNTEEFMANLAGLEGAQSKGVRLQDTDIGKKILDSRLLSGMHDYYKDGMDMGPMNDPTNEVRRLLQPPPVQESPRLTDRIMKLFGK